MSEGKKSLDELSDRELGEIVDKALHGSLDLDLHTDCADNINKAWEQIGRAIRQRLEKGV